MLKQFIFKTLLSCAIVACLAVPGELLLRNIPNNYSVKNDYLERHAEGINTLVLGHSHAFMGINPDLMPGRTFNLAMPGQTLDLDLALLEKYKDRLNSLKVIVLPISVLSLYKTMADIAPDGQKFYGIYHGVSSGFNPRYHAELLNIHHSVLNRILDYYHRGKHGVTCTPTGYEPKYETQNDSLLRMSGIISASEHMVADIECVPKIVAYLQKIIDIARKKNCRVVLFSAPTHHYYRDRLNKYQLQKTDAEIARLVSHNDHVIYQNWMADPDFQSGDFHNASHLNIYGARKLAPKLNRLIAAGRTDAPRPLADKSPAN